MRDTSSYGDAFQAKIQGASTLNTAKGLARRAIDELAEMRRRAWITPGDGQQAEYAATREEALAWKTGDNPALYPQLSAEVDALAGIGQTLTIDDIVPDIIATISALDAAMAQIKAARRGGKLRIDQAASNATVLSEFQAAKAAINAVETPS